MCFWLLWNWLVETNVGAASRLWCTSPWNFFNSFIYNDKRKSKSVNPIWSFQCPTDQFDFGCVISFRWILWAPGWCLVNKSCFDLRGDRSGLKVIRFRWVSIWFLILHGIVWKWMAWMQMEIVWAHGVWKCKVPWPIYLPWYHHLVFLGFLLQVLT